MRLLKCIQYIIIAIFLTILSISLFVNIVDKENGFKQVDTPICSDPNKLDYYKVYKNKNFLFRDENYKILLISDLHIWASLPYSHIRYQLINETILKTDPDLIVLTGDNVTSVQTEIAMTNLCAFINHYNIPWTFVFGNHDDEKEDNKQALADIGKSYNKCLFQDGPEDIDGIGNYFLELKDEEGNLIQALVFFDTHGSNVSGDFDGVHENQIEWYENYISQDLKEKAPSLLFMHVPFYEFVDSYEKEYGPYDKDIGLFLFSKNNLFDSINNLGSTKGVFCSHIHEKNYSILYQGIRLTFCNTSNIDIILDTNFKINQLGGTLLTINRDRSFFVENITAEETYQKLFNSKK